MRHATLVNESLPHRQSLLLRNLAQAMCSTAETARQESIEQCRADATAYLELAKARQVDETAAIRAAGEADFATIRERFEAQIEQVRVETERRLELLEQQRAGYRSTLELLIQRVEERSREFQNELARFFERLLQVSDPTVFASLASHMPSPPDFALELEPPAREPEAPDRELDLQPPAEVDPRATEPEIPPRELVGQARAEVAPTRMPLAPGTLSGAGAVRGRYYPEWYGEVERLREIGDEHGAVVLLLDIVSGTEAESYAEGVPVSPTAYAELADMYRARGDSIAEFSILDRFSRQSLPKGVEPSRLLTRLASLKGSTKR
jgi:hypothetical protein